MVRRSFLYCLLCLLCALCSFAQSDSIPTVTAPAHLRISLLTCGPGEEVWETFGHACLRIIDSSKTGGESDVIYNYGFFESTPDNPIEKQVVSGRVIDLLDTITYDELMYEYNIKKRAIDEQVFLLSEHEKALILAYLKTNLLKRNRYYEFDTFYDNCSTRITDMFRKLFGGAFVPGPSISGGDRLTFRNVSITRLCPQQAKYWFGFGLNLTYASRSDRVLDNTTAMYMPIFLSKGFSGATLNGHKLCADKTSIRSEDIVWPQRANGPFIYSLIIALCTIGCLLYRARPLVGNIAATLVLLLTGLLGCGMVYLWCIDGEPAFKDNYNVLWALPTNIIVPFLGSAVKRIYSVLAIALLALALVLHVLLIQLMPLTELTPILLCLLWIYAFMYKGILGK